MNTDRDLTIKTLRHKEEADGGRTAKSAKDAKGETESRTDRTVRTDRTMNQRPETRNPALTRAQMRKIWAVAHEIKGKGESGNGQVGREEWVHGVVYQVTGKESLRELSVHEGKRVIDFLERLAHRRPGAEWHGAYRMSVDAEGEIVVIITPAQAAKMRALAAKIGWDDRQVCTVATRQLGRYVGSLRAIRAEEARRVMGLLESIVERREREERQMEIPDDVRCQMEDER